ncbi:MAG: sigma factor [Actinomycetes bacterium]
MLHHILKRVSYASDPYGDLLQVASLGLTKAALRFDADRGVGLSTYATLFRRRMWSDLDSSSRLP